jgi:predicted phage baseplate assembly protein
VLPEILLDDIRFQELVSEARTRIIRHSPEWTEHNVSDPGITLIELFAWLTEMLVYRINRIPERLQFGLLELVGIRPAPPRCAVVDVRFMLEQPGTGAIVPAGTEIASPRTAGSDSIVFQTTADLSIPERCELVAYGIERRGKVELAAVTGESAHPAAGLQNAFASPSADGDAILLGFRSPIGGLVIGLMFESTRAEGRGLLDSADPPLIWEAATGDGQWEPATVVADETGGFLWGGGTITLELPGEAQAVTITGAQHYWLRCRVDVGVAGYARSPEISAVRATVAGATANACHAATVVDDILGLSEGIPGAAYPLRRRPVLPLAEAEALEVREPGADQWTAWQPVDSFGLSSRSDTHFQLDATRGEVRFGPAIRQPDGGWRRYGAVPPAGSVLRMRRYRHGGGSAGNVAPRALSILPRPVAGISGAMNPRAARGGVDPESLEGARERARLDVRARSRAVTTEDFQHLALAASSRVARAVCVAPEGAGPVRVHLLPRVEPADRLLEADELVPDRELMELVAGELDRYRLLGTSVRLLPVRLRGVSVVADVRASPLADIDRVQNDVAHALYVYLNPLIGGSPSGTSDGWPAGRAVNQGELFGIVYAIPGVEFVNILRMYETNVRTGEQAPQPAESRVVLEPDELIASGRHIVKAAHRD